MSKPSGERDLVPVSASAALLANALAQVVDQHDPVFLELAQALSLMLRRLAHALAERDNDLFTAETYDEHTRRALAAYEHLYYTGSPEDPAVVYRLSQLFLAVAAGPEAVNGWFRAELKEPGR